MLKFALKSCGTIALLAMSSIAWGQSFGRVVAIGGHSSDLALDEARGALYVANFTANRVDVVNLASYTVNTSFNVASQPSSLSISPDGRYLVVGHYGNFQAPAAPRNALTVIDLESHSRRTFALADPPLGVAFARDGRALVVTSTQFILFDPMIGTMQVIDTVTGVVAKTLPQPPANFPTQIVGASVAASRDGMHVFGVTDSILFRYDLSTRSVFSGGYVASPELGPRAISVADDGGFYVAGWAMFDRRGMLAQFPNPAGLLNVGSHAIDSRRGVIYGQIPEGESSQDATPPPSDPAPGSDEAPPVLMVMDADNLTVRERLRLPENLAGKAVLAEDGNVMYALSDSGVVILPVGELGSVPRVAADREDLVFRSNFCNQGVIREEFTVYNRGGDATPFRVSSTIPGVRFSVTDAVTPATIEVLVDPAAFQGVRGTLTGQIQILSPTAVNVVKPIRILISLQEPDQRGTFVNVPGRLVDLLADPMRNRFFVLRQDTNEVLVFDGGNYQQIAALRTGNTPTSMAVTFDRRYLLVGNDNSQIANVYDLETLDQLQPIRFAFGHYPRWLAASGRAILAATRVAGQKHTIDRVDLFSRVATELPSLGVFENTIDVNTAMVASGNGSSILIAQADGNLLLYNANTDSFTISRKNSDPLGGAIAASSFDQFVVGNLLMNASLVTTRRLDSSVELTSGFAFVDDIGFRTGTPESGGAGLIQRVDLATGIGIASTRIAEAPLEGHAGAAFTRTLAVLADRSVIINLTTSGFTVLTWNYDASVAIPRITDVVNAADGTRPVAPGGLIVVRGRDLGPVSIASQQMPLPMALGESCLTVNGLAVPMLLVSPTEINAQLPFQAEGNVTMVLRTPGGVSDNYNLTILPTAPSIFRSELAPGFNAPLVVRTANWQVVTASNPVRQNDELTIYLTGMGKVTPEIPAGQPAPGDPAPTVLTQPTVELAGRQLEVDFAGLVPNQIGVYEIRVKVPWGIPKGMSQPLRIVQGSSSTTVLVRVID